MATATEQLKCVGDVIGFRQKYQKYISITDEL